MKSKCVSTIAAAAPSPSGAPRRARPAVASGVLTVLLLVLVLAACESHYVMSRTPGAYQGTLGPMKVCPAGQGACTDSPTYDTSVFNPANAKVYVLPDCPFGIQALVVPAPGSSNALVQCAAPPQQTPPQPDGGIPTATLAPSH